MALPLLLGGAVVAGIAGIVAGVSAKDDFDEAEDLNEEAEDTYNYAEESLKGQRDRTQKRLEHLGRVKVQLHQNSLKPFVDSWSRIKNVDYAGPALGDEMSVGEAEISDIQRVVLKMEEVVGGGIAALGGGVFAGIAVYGSVGLLGTASTGTAIAGLSGAAATNATLAWFGGGSLATGGLGMAAAPAILGGIVAGPVLLVSGLLLSKKGTEALEAARSNLAEAEVAAEAMKTAEVAARAILRKANEVSKILKVLQDDYLDEALPKLELLVSRNDDYRTYSAEQKRLVMRTTAVAKTAHLVSEAPLFDEDGVVTNRIRHALKKANDSLKAINAM